MTPLEKLRLELLNIAGTHQRATVAMIGAAQTVRAIRDLGPKNAEIDANLGDNALEAVEAMRAWQATIEPFRVASENLLKEIVNGLISD